MDATIVDGQVAGQSPDPVTKVRQALSALGAAGEVLVLPEPVPTAVAAAAALGCDVAAIANSLIFDAGGVPLLILASGGHRVDVTRVAQHLGTGKIRRATPEFVLTHTGQQVGGVAPVGHPVPLRAVVDVALAPFPVVWAGAGHEQAMFPTSFDELVRITGGTAMDVA